MDRPELMRLAERQAAGYRIAPPEQLAGGRAGGFAGSLDGQSIDFHDYRQYQPGDDLRRVDWRAYARTGQMQLKLFREEVSPLVELHVDSSASMGAYPGKEQAAVFVAAFLRAATLAAEGRPVLCHGGGRFFGDAFAAALGGMAFRGEGWSEAAPAPAGRAVRFFVSDFLFGDGVAGWFGRRAAGSLAFAPIMILSLSEREPAWRGFHRLRDVENPNLSLDLSLDEAAASGYRRRLKMHEDMLEDESRRHGGRLLRLDAPDGDLDDKACAALVKRLAEERVVTVK